MDLKICRISLRNFKGIESLDVDFGETTAILGQNATGKTTIFDGFIWCLFGKDSQNKSDFEIKPLDRAGQEVHNLEHSVEVVLLADSQEMKCKKVYSEKYTRKRGSAQAEFTGHTTNHFINDVPMQEKEFNERIHGLMDEAVFRLVTDPRFFNEQLHWTERRRLLMEVCGDVSTVDVIASDASLAKLSALLNGHNIDDFKKIITAKRAEINRELEKIPTRIDEVKRTIQDVRPDISKVPGIIEERQAYKAVLENQLADLRNGGAIPKKRIEIREVEAEILTRRNDHMAKKEQNVSPLRSELGETLEAMFELQKRIKQGEADLVGRDMLIKQLDIEMDLQRKKWVDLDSQKIEVNDHCPTCRQPLPENEVNEALEKLLMSKSERLADIQTRGKAAKETKDKHLSDCAQIGEDLLSYKHSLATLKAQAEEKEQLIASIKDEPIDLSAYEEKLLELKADLENMASLDEGSINDVRQKIELVSKEISSLREDLHVLEVNESAHARINELQAQEKELAKVFEDLESKLFLVENFIRAKVSLVDERINSHFSLVRFRLFENQINNGLREVCETTLHGVPYRSINNAGRIQAGMDIIKTLQGHYEITAPVWIDNRESIVELPPMNCQTISLIVSEYDKKIRIEKGV